MVIERFRNSDPAPIYARFAQRGRQLPDGVTFVDSWVTLDGSTCYQVVEATDRQALDPWIAAWHDLVGFEVLAVQSSKEAARRYGPGSGGIKP